MNLNKFTIKSQEALQNAQEIASSYGNQLIEAEHLLAALLQDAQGTVVPILQKTGANLTTLRIKMNEALEKLPKVSGSSIANQSLSPALGRLLELSRKKAADLKDEYVSTEHMLLALAEAGDGAVASLLRAQNVTPEAILGVLKDIRGNQRVTDQNPEEKYQALEKYGRDLNELARKGKTDPVIGRDEEIRRVLQVLARRTKNNPVLIG